MKTRKNTYSTVSWTQFDSTIAGNFWIEWAPHLIME